MMRIHSVPRPARAVQTWTPGLGRSQRQQIRAILRRSAAPAAQPEGGLAIRPELEGEIRRQQGTGAPLSEQQRGFFEPRLGHDLGHVRLHTSAPAERTASAMDASALTLGGDIFFGSGQYQPATRAGQRLLAHELAHVVQQSGHGQPGDAVPAGNRLMPYRPAKAVNFGANDTATLKEKVYDSKAPDPYIDTIVVAFDKTVTLGGESVPAGKLSATYASNGASPMPAAISNVDVVGGYPSEGLTDAVSSMGIKRIEGWGYHHLNPPAADRVGPSWPQNKYYKPAQGSSASMSYALFFFGKQAIHYGGLAYGSLACVHVADLGVMRQLNYHSRVTTTKVDVTYTEAALDAPCCERYQYIKQMRNPCRGRDPKKCTP